MAHNYTFQWYKDGRIIEGESAPSVDRNKIVDYPPFDVFLEYEIRSSWWTGFIFWEWGLKLSAKYYELKAKRKYNRYLNSLNSEMKWTAHINDGLDKKRECLLKKRRVLQEIYLSLNMPGRVTPLQQYLQCQIDQINQLLDSLK